MNIQISTMYNCFIKSNMNKILTLLLVLFVATNLYAQERYYVSTTGNNLDGLTWESAFTDVQTAIDVASQNASEWNQIEIWISKGTYAHGAPMKMASYISLIGGFVGTENDPSERIFAEETIFTGEGRYTVFENIFTADEPLLGASIEDITILDGFTSNDNSAAAFHNEFSELSIFSCKIQNNQSNGISSSGAIYNFCSYISVYNSDFSFNSTNGVYSKGGAIQNKWNSDLYIENTLFSFNSSAYGGGAISNDDGSKMQVHSSSFTGNSTGSWGGCSIYSSRSYDYAEIYSDNREEIFITSCDFSGATTSSSGGAYIVAGESKITVEASNFYWFSGFSAISTSHECNINKCNFEDGDGIMLTSNGNLNIKNSSFLNNKVAIQCSGKTNIVNSTFSSNEIAIKNFSEKLEIIHSVFYKNSEYALQNIDGGYLEALSSIFWANGTTVNDQIKDIDFNYNLFYCIM